MKTLQQRLNSKTYVQDGHLIWGGYLDRYGYGKMAVESKPLLTHRLAWEIAYGSIPEGIQVLHLCDTPPCILPWHLYLGTPADNMRDMARRKTSCVHGHPFDEANTYYAPNGGRHCRACAVCNTHRYRGRKGR
ncbi:hypothetical protein LCGC14_2002090 [marine sediment metagenome]|uniref:HNH nuclease domain-containing protein n=1 Tax=marine sediment metagenome TaxID=412755 RepID=A0A0F9F2S7_9ZZZZ